MDCDSTTGFKNINYNGNYNSVISNGIALWYTSCKRNCNFLGDMLTVMKFLYVNKIKLALVVVSVIIMGFCISFLNEVKFGTDPCTMFNLGMATKLGISLGNWQALFNCVLVVFVWGYRVTHRLVTQSRKAIEVFCQAFLAKKAGFGYFYKSNSN